MTGFPFRTPERFVVSGDWHGNAAHARGVIEAARAAGIDVVVQLGDFGFWHGDHGDTYRQAVSAAATAHNVHVVWIDGNHENFDLLEHYPVDPVTGLRTVAPNITHLPRGTRWDWFGVQFCALGGGTSLDRPQRVLGSSWWPQEAVTYAQAQQTMSDGTCDVLLTHDCPAGVDIPGIDPHTSILAWPETELRTAWAHRDVLGEVARVLQPTHVFHGHFHVRYTTEASLTPGMTTIVHGLGADDGSVDDAFMVIDVFELSRESRARRAL